MLSIIFPLSFVYHCIDECIDWWLFPLWTIPLCSGKLLSLYTVNLEAWVLVLSYQNCTFLRCLSCIARLSHVHYLCLKSRFWCCRRQRQFLIIRSGWLHTGWWINMHATFDPGTSVYSHEFWLVVCTDCQYLYSAITAAIQHSTWRLWFMGFLVPGSSISYSVPFEHA